ncbi:MAG: hypothetical protein ACREA9_26665 [Pyrinomonadaceae bacterium]
MSLNLYGDETRVIHFLRAIGMTDTEARIYTAVLCRQYRAPKTELVSALKFYLHDTAIDEIDAEIDAVLEALLKRGLLRVIDGLSEDPIEASTPWQDALRKAYPSLALIDSEMVEIISDSLKAFTDFSPRERKLIERLGWATWEKPRQSFKEAIRQARKQIRMGVYSSITVYDEIKEEVSKAWINRQEMKVQILMFSPELAAKMEQNPDLANDVTRRTLDWRNLYTAALAEAKKFGNRPELEIRYLQSEELTAFHRVLLVDDRIWMLNVHRPGVERGIEGIVYQGSGEGLGKSNVYNLLEHYWNMAWEGSVAPTPTGRAFYQIRRYQHLIIFVAAVFLAWYAHANQGDWLGIRNDWWGGAFMGIILTEIYANYAIVVGDVLRFLKWLIAILQKLVN